MFPWLSVTPSGRHVLPPPSPIQPTMMALPGLGVEANTALTPVAWKVLSRYAVPCTNEGVAAEASQPATGVRQRSVSAFIRTRLRGVVVHCVADVGESGADRGGQTLHCRRRTQRDQPH